MTIEQLAAMTQREYESIRDEMVSREQLRITEGNILRAIDGIGAQLSAYASRWTSEFEKFADNLHAIEQRLNTLERSNEQK